MTRGILVLIVLTLLVTPAVAGPATTLTSIAPTELAPGDEVTLMIADSPADVRLRIDFESSDARVRIPASVITDETRGDDRIVTVVVPNGVRSGRVRVDLLTDTGPLEVIADPFDADLFTAAPHLVGYAMGIEGDRDVILAFATDADPAAVVLYGYNLETITGASLDNSLNDPIDADSVVAFDPDDFDYELPAGMTGVVVELPEFGPMFLGPGSLCVDGSAPLAIALEGEWPSGATFEIPPIDVQMIDGTALPFRPEPVPASIRGWLMPTGTRSGEIEITYLLWEDSASSRWTLIPEFRDPTVLDDDDFLAWRPCASSPLLHENGFLVLPGNSAHPSRVAGMIGPGMVQRFVWDTTEALEDGGLPSGRTVTRLRFRATNREESVGTACAVGVWESGPIVIDNPSNVFSTIEESFDSLETFASGDAIWDAAAGELRGTVDGVSPFGEGTAVVEILAGETVVFDTDLGSLVRIDPAPLDYFAIDDNPGAAQSPPEFWVESLSIESGAIVEVVGSAPLVIRCAGVDDPDATVVQIGSVIDVSGEEGEEGSVIGGDGIGGLGGAGGPGGGSGGRGGSIAVNGMNDNRPVTSMLLATDGEGVAPGEGGLDISLTRNFGFISNPRGGPGGGGGHRDIGEAGVILLSNSIRQSEPGEGGEVAGSERIDLLFGGSGGGGGGAVPLRADNDPDVPVTGRGGGGGGGGGGAVQIVAAGSIVIDGAIIADGGNGADPVSAGGGAPGGGGSGGAIFLQATGTVEFGDDSLLRAMGALGARVGTTVRGGFGSPGRIRIEANDVVSIPVSFEPCEEELITNDGTPAGIPATPSPPTSGFCPEPSIGAFVRADQLVSVARTTPFTRAGNGVFPAEVEWGAVVLEPATQPDGTEVRVLFEGAQESLDRPGEPGTFSAAVADAEQLGDAEYVRLVLLLYANAETEEFPTVESLRLSFASDAAAIPFVRGDVDGDGTTNPILDSIALLEWGFVSGSPPPCMAAADADGSGGVSPLSDPIYLLEFGFNGGPPPPAPGPDECGPGGPVGPFPALSCDVVSERCLP